MADRGSEKNGGLQTFREVIAGVISLVILVAAVWMLADTFRAARESAAGTDAEVKAKGDAYVREKDVMLYGLALLGTVLGYYLGRVPAEMHAQQAQKNADAAQGQLSAAQTKLGEATKTASDATATAIAAAKERDQVKDANEKMKEDVVTTVARVQKSIKAAAPGAKTLASGEGAGAGSSLQEAQSELEALLQRWS